MMRLYKTEFPNILDRVPIVITNKHGQSRSQEFVYSREKWYDRNEYGLYSFDMDMNYDWYRFTETCPPAAISEINNYVNKIGELSFIVWGECGVTAFINLKTKNKYKKDYYKVKEWFWENYKKMFYVANTNKYYK